jgi:hypothetical protein
MEDPKTFASNKVQEKECATIGATSGKLKNLCKADLEKYKENKIVCDYLGLDGTKFTQCMENPSEFAEKDTDSATCEANGAKKGTLEFSQCMKNPYAYSACKEIPHLNTIEFNQCMEDPQAFAQKRVDKANEESKKKELEGKCDALGAKSGANKKLCMEDPDKYSNAKSQCESMNATGSDFNKCVKDPESYKQDYDLKNAAEEKGMKVRQYEKQLEDQQQLEALQKLLG